MHDLLMLNSFRCIKILGYWKTSRKCLTGTQSHQSTHTSVCVILGSKEEPLDDMKLPPGNT